MSDGVASLTCFLIGRTPDDDALPPFEANGMKITDEMVERASRAYFGHGGEGRYSIHAALEAALNPPPVVCKNCGSGEREHVLMRRGPSFVDSYGCPGYFFEAAP